MTTRPFQFACIENSDSPKCELLEQCQHSEGQPSPKSRLPNSEQLRLDRLTIACKICYRKLRTV